MEIFELAAALGQKLKEDERLVRLEKAHRAYEENEALENEVQEKIDKKVAELQAQKAAEEAARRAWEESQRKLKEQQQAMTQQAQDMGGGLAALPGQGGGMM